MSEEVFYHYTDAESAQDIFLSGKIRPSLFSQGNAVHGDGACSTGTVPLRTIRTGSLCHFDSETDCVFWKDIDKDRIVKI